MHPLKQYKANRRRTKFLTRKLGDVSRFDELTDDTLLDRMLEGERRFKRPTEGIFEESLSVNGQKVYSKLQKRKLVQ